MLKVAFLSFDFGEYSVRLASALAQDAEVLLLLPERKAAPHLSKLADAVKFEPFDKPRLRQPFRQLRMTRTILRRIKTFQPDVIHLQQGHLWFNFALPLLARYPLVLTIHDLKNHVGDAESHEPQMLLDFGFKRANQLIVHSRRLREEAVPRLHFQGDRVHVIPHIALGDDTPHDAADQEDHLILFFGRIWGYKGLEFLIKAEPLISEQVPEARFVIAGEGADFAPYRRMMVHPDKFIVHNEYVSYDLRSQLFRQSSVVVLPYIEASQSGVIPLSYSFGKPVVATSVGGLPEMIDQGETGYVVPPRDEKSLANAIVCLLKNEGLRRRMGANGRRKLGAEWSPCLIAQRTLQVYRLAVDGSARGSGKR